MKNRQNNSTRASALQITLSVALLSASAILFASSFKAAAPSLPAAAASEQTGFYPPLPVPALSEQTITVSLPIDTLDVSVPIATVVTKPVVTTNIDASQNIIGFQGDFLFDSSVIDFDSVTGPVQPAGLTATQWNVSGNVNPGPGTMKILRVSAFKTGPTNVLSGSGVMYQLRMVRVSSTPGASSTMNWQPSPDDFEFFDTGFNVTVPAQSNGLITITPVCNLMQAFDQITTLVPGDWFMRNNSQPGPGTTGWFQGITAVFVSQSGAADSYIAANYQNGTGTSTLSNWLLTPPVTLQNGATMTFWTRTVNAPALPDRLQVRMSTNGVSTNVGATAASVGDFTTLLLDINPTYTLTGYPNVWTQFAVTVSGVASSTPGRLAFRYFVENGGPNGANSDYIGIDTVQYTCPTPTPIPITISGSVSYCSNPIPSSVPNVTLTLSGVSGGSTTTNGSGNYEFSLASGGSYTVTPSKAALTPGSSGINTIDALAVRGHFLSCASNPNKCLTGCRLTAADVNDSGGINTLDVIQIQRFFLGYTGSGNVGKYQFTPASRTYSGVVTDHTGQNYDALIFGDVASHFAERP